MGDEFYSLDQVAGLLELHVRTVRAYVREGRIKAVRIGKQYRVARADLETFTSSKLPSAPVIRTSRNVEISSIVQIDAIDPDNASRIANTLVAVCGASSRADAKGDDAAQVSCRYNESAASLKIIMMGSLKATTGLLNMIDLLLAQPL